jgi:hypothetical protein
MDTTAPERPDLNTGGGDHDRHYVPGHTDLYLCEIERTRLTVLRAGIRAGKFPGDTTADLPKEGIPECPSS